MNEKPSVDYLSRTLDKVLDVIETNNIQESKLKKDIEYILDYLQNNFVVLYEP